MCIRDSEYILKKSNEEVAGLFMPILKEHGIEAPMDKVVTVVGLMKDRVSFIKDVYKRQVLYGNSDKCTLCGPGGV